jgi:transcriptional regulator with XRE-family HTH domain
MQGLAKREVSVNRILLSDLIRRRFRRQHGDMGGVDLRELFGAYIAELLKTSELRPAEFARRTGIVSSTLSSMKHGKRAGSWKHLEGLMARGIVTPAEVFSRLYDLAEHREHPGVKKLDSPRLGREQLRQRLASGEIHARAAVAAQAPPTGAPPLRPRLTERLRSRKTGAKG